MVKLHTLSLKTIEYLHIHFNFNNKRTKLNFIDIYAAFLLAKIAAIYVFLLCKIVGLKIRSCKIFGKFQGWVAKKQAQGAKRLAKASCSSNDIEELPRVHILEENWNVEDVSEEELRKRCNDILKRLE